MDQDEVFNYWLSEAEENLQMADEMFANKHYDWALFMGQLYLEKLIKALYTKQLNQTAPFIHDLVKLLIGSNINLTDIQKQDLIEISAYNIQARYPEIKLKHYRKSTPEYAYEWMKKIKEYGLWIKQQF